MRRNTKGGARDGISYGDLQWLSDLSMPASNCFPALRHRSSESALSNVDSGGLQVPVHAGVGPWIIDGEFGGQPNGLDHGLNPLESSSHLT